MSISGTIGLGTRNCRPPVNAVGGKRDAPNFATVAFQRRIERLPARIPQRPQAHCSAVSPRGESPSVRCEGDGPHPVVLVSLVGPKEGEPKDDAADEADSRPAAEPNGTETGEPKDPTSDGTGTETGAALTCEEQAKAFLDECMATK